MAAVVRNNRPMTTTDIYTFRTTLGLSQQELADELGVTQAAVSQWESGTKQPRPIVFKMLEVLRDRAACGVKKISAVID